MNRLNKTVKTAIVEAALAKSGLPAKLADRDARYHAWANTTRIETNGISDELIEGIEFQFKLLKNQLPEHLFTGYNLITRRAATCFNLGGARVYHGFDNAVYCSCNQPALPLGHTLVEQFHALEAEKKELTGQVEQLKAQVHALLEPVTTVKRLLEIWPEAKELLPAAEIKAAKPPAILVSNLNATIGLPSDDVQEAA